MVASISGYLDSARRMHFVGRAAEQAQFLSALETAQWPFHVLYIFGPGGIGKSTLLREYMYLAEQHQIPSLYVDARNIEPSPEVFLEVLRHIMGLPPQTSPLDALTGYVGPLILAIDTYEVIAPLDNWLRETFLPQLPASVLVMMAGRDPLSLAWRADPGWQALLHVIALRNLTPEEGREYLTRRSVPADQHYAILNFTHGHPLALSLVADVFAQRRNFTFHPEESPNVVKTLLEQFVQKVPGPAHRAALEVCALVRLTTESLLSEVLSVDAHDLFDWLRSLSFIEAQRGGLFPHDLAREALVADLRWRNPDWYAELHRRARQYYNSRIKQTTGHQQQYILFDLIYLHRENPFVQPFFEWQTSGSLATEAVRPADLPMILDMVARFEGEESARLAAHWIERQPQGALVVRDPERQPMGFLMMVALDGVSGDDRRVDPAVQAAASYLQACCPLRPGEIATLFRFWMARDTYQDVSPVQSLIFVTMVRHYVTTPGLAFTFLPCSDPDFWSPAFTYADLSRLPDADFTIGGLHYGVYGHDWRVRPPAAWLELMGERELGMSPEQVAAPVATPSLIVLSETEFAEAVYQALRDYSQPDMLRTNPLLRSRLVIEQVGQQANDQETATTLRALIRQAADSMQQSPRQSKFYRAVYHTYLQPAPTQEQAAEILDLPFSTFRRHLKSGIIRIAEILWQQEIRGLEK